MNNNFHNKSDTLRRKAEDLLARLPAEQSEAATTDILNVIHELHVHQIELELQNEELQSAHRSLEKSKSDYMRLYHQAPVGYVVLDRSGITRKINMTFASMLDRDAATMSGTPFADFLVAEDRAIFRARLKAFYKNPFEKQIDVRLSQKGKPLYVSLRAIVNAEELTEAGEGFNELLVTVTDINESHEYQAALEESRRDLEEILSSISDGFLALDEKFRILYFNSTAEQLLQADRQDVLGRKLFDAFPMARGSDFEKGYRKALETGEVVHFETFFDKPPFNDWFEVTTYPYRGGLSVFFRVITERKRVENDLSESQRALALYNRIATIFLTSAEGTIFHDTLDQLLETFSCSFGYIGYINQEGVLVCPTMTREIWEKCQMKDKDISFPPSCWGGLWGRSLTEKKSILANENLTTPEGHITLNNALAVPILNHDRLVGQFALANKDGGFAETDLKLLETTAKQTAPILQSLLDRLEKEKLKEQLENVERQLEKVEGLNRMAAATAHNYNNLLTIIMGSIELAMEDLPEHYSKTRARLSNAFKASQNGADIGAMLLTYLGHTTKGRAVVDLSRLTAQALEQFDHGQRDNVDITFRAPEQPPVIAADPELMERLLHILLDNAMESLENKKGDITVKVDTRTSEQIPPQSRFPLEWRPTSDHYGMLEVSDGGCGIAAENIDKLFDPFYSEKFTGRGMGLAMVLGIVRIYKGVVTVDTARDKGSIFRVFLPLAENSG